MRGRCKLGVLEHFRNLAREAGLHDPGGLAAQLLLLMDGAWVAARMFGQNSHPGSVADAARALIDAQLRDPSGSAPRHSR